VARGPAQLVGQDRDDLRRPQELVLQVDEAARGAQRADVALEDAKVAARDAVVHVLGHRTHDLHRAIAGRGWRRRLLDVLVAVLPPAQREVVVHILDRRAGDARGHVVPAQPPPGRMRIPVVAIAAEVGHVDPTHERELAVDRDRLLVVAVKRMLARIGLALDSRAPGEVLHRLLHLAAGGVEHRYRRAGPHQHAHVDLLGQLGQQRAEHDRRIPLGDLEVRFQVPAGDVHEAACSLQRVRDCRQRLRAIDQHVE
jgi:hypothetical protein